MNLPTQFDSIKAYAAHIIDRGMKIEMIDFLTNCNRMFLKMEEGLLQELIKWVSKDDEFCINANEAFPRYGIDKVSQSKDVLRVLERRELVENEDYDAGHVACIKSGREYTTKVYMLKPDAFKRCLIGAKNTKIYVHYYLTIEKCAFYHTKIERAYYEGISTRQSVEIREQSAKIDAQSAKIDAQSAEVHKLLEFGTTAHVDLVDIKKTLTDIVPRVINRPVNRNKVKQICLIHTPNLKRSDRYDYQVFTAAELYIDNRLITDNYKHAVEAFREDSPNAEVLWQNIRQEFISAGMSVNGTKKTFTALKKHHDAIVAQFQKHFDSPRSEMTK